MMKKFLALLLAVALASGCGLAFAAELKSGLAADEDIAPFDVVKCAGPDDKVKVGDQLCYRCKYGNRPMVMIFTRNTDEKVADLVKKLDKAVAKHSKAELKAFVNLIGENRDSLEADAKEFAKKNEIKETPVVVPVEFENGPADYGINPEAAVTILIAKKGKVASNHAFAEAKELDEKALEALMADVEKVIK